MYSQNIHIVYILYIYIVNIEDMFYTGLFDHCTVFWSCCIFQQCSHTAHATLSLQPLQETNLWFCSCLMLQTHKKPHMHQQWFI